jgi:hypothetical protein
VPASAMAGYEPQLRGTRIHVRFSYRASHWTHNVTLTEADEYDTRIILPLSAVAQQKQNTRAFNPWFATKDWLLRHKFGV